MKDLEIPELCIEWELLNRTKNPITKRKIKKSKVVHSMSFSISSSIFTFFVRTAYVKRSPAPKRAGIQTSMCQNPWVIKKLTQYNWLVLLVKEMMKILLKNFQD